MVLLHYCHFVDYNYALLIIIPSCFLQAIDFNVTSCGKYCGHTKRKVQFRFWQAIEEHELALIWSINSGKQVVLLDGRVIYSTVSRSSTVDISHTTHDNTNFRLVAHRYPSSERGSYQYDLFINGKSFFSLPKMLRCNGNHIASSDETNITEDLSIDTAVLCQDPNQESVSIDTTAFQNKKPKQEKLRNVKRTYIVKVPPHIFPGDLFFANGTDGRRMLVTCPPSAGPGMELLLCLRLSYLYLVPAEGEYLSQT